MTADDSVVMQLWIGFIVLFFLYFAGKLFVELLKVAKANKREEEMDKIRQACIDDRIQEIDREWNKFIYHRK